MTAFDDIGALPDASLLDIVAGSEGAGARLLSGDEVSGIFRLNHVAIAQRAELPEGDARRIEAAFTLAHRIREQRGEKRPVLETIGDAVALLGDRARLATQEELWIVCLDKTQRLTGIRLVSIGTAETIPVDTALIVRHACELGAAMFVLVHYHVHGSQHPPKPSLDDYTMTATIRRIAKSLDVMMLDHLVIGRSGKSVSVLRRLERAERAEAKRKAAEEKKARRKAKARAAKRKAAAKKATGVLTSDDSPDTERDPYPVGSF